MHTNLSIKDNFSSFSDEESGITVFIDSFDNIHFDIRMGDANESTLAGTIIARTDNELNKKVIELFNRYKNEKAQK
ncbi:MAG TPA: hypothetical protein ENJ08_08435 [Gammaproteobacteria bacterium]|nr:hypothetical protein [Gammaproteobacteria bacterium]